VDLDTQVEINATRIRFIHNKGSGGPEQINIDAARLGIYKATSTSFNIDLEYQWTTANYMDAFGSVCIYVASHPAGIENLEMYYRDGSSWTSLGSITSIGWNNFSATGLTSGTYTIRLLGASESGDTTQDIWTIDCIFLNTYNTTNYRIDLEYQWTNAHFNEQGETVCMYFASHTGGSEALNVYYWNGANWLNLGTVSSNGWKNFTAPGLTSPTYTIQLKGATEAADATPDIWTIDCMFLQTYTFS